MTSLTPQAPGSRRHTDHPSLWISVIAGSLLLHTSLFLAMRYFGVQILAPASEPAPIEVDFADAGALTAADAASTQPPVARSRAASPGGRSSTPAATLPNSQISAVPPRQPSEAPANNPPVNPDAVPPRRRSRQNSSPSSSSPAEPISPQKDTPERRDPVQPEQPNSQASDSQNTQDNSQQPPNENTEAGNPSSNRSPATSPDKLPSQTNPSSPVDGTGGNPNSNGSTQGSGTTDGNSPDGLSDVQVDRQPQGGKGLQLSVVTVRSADRGKDKATKDAQVRRRSIGDPALVYPPDVRLNLGQSIRVVVVLDNTGKPQQVTVLEGQSAQVSELVQRLVEQLEFTPAQQEWGPVASQLELEIRLDAL